MIDFFNKYINKYINNYVNIIKYLSIHTILYGLFLYYVHFNEDHAMNLTNVIFIISSISFFYQNERLQGLDSVDDLINNNDRVKWINKNKTFFMTIWGISGLSFLFTILLNWKKLWIFLVVFTPIMFFYKKIKNIPLMKSIFVAFSISLVLYVIPVLLSESYFNPKMYVSIYLHFLACLNTQDMVDYEGDMKGHVLTFPTVLGINTTYLFNVVFFWMSGILNPLTIWIRYNYALCFLSFPKYINFVWTKRQIWFIPVFILLYLL